MKRLKILIIPPFIPYPPDDGGKICIFGFIDYLRHNHEFHVFMELRNKCDRNSVEELARKWPEVFLHTIDNISTPKTSFWIKHTLKAFLIKCLKLAKIYIWRVKSDIQLDPYHLYGDLRKITPFVPFGLKYIKSLSQLLLDQRFDIIQTELTPMLNLIHLFPNCSKKIFVQIESRESLLEDFGRANKIEDCFSKYISKNAGFLEYSYMKLFDAVFALNEKDKDMIQQNVPMVRVFNSPFSILDSQINKIDIGSYTPRHLIFIGGESHFPNYDGVKWFLSDIIGRVDSRYSPIIYVTGLWSKATMKEFKKEYDKIFFTGFVDDLTKYLKDSICIVPIRLGGGGIRAKILFCMAQNVPVVSTDLACVGIKATHGKELIIANSSEDFAANINNLFEKPAVAKELIKAAESLIESTYNQKVMSERRNEFYYTIMKS
jgi:glycosyltransferase involved in cell wall biosynthesis